MQFIVIDALDGCGKATQVNMLVDRLKREGKKVLMLDYPVYGSKGCSLVEAYLHGELAESASDVNPYAAALFYAVDRYCDSLQGTLKKIKTEDYDCIIANRYTTSNAIYQCTKLPKAEWGTFCDWLFDLEYSKLQLPKPDCVLYLSMPVSVSQKLLSKRYEGDMTKKDLHEADIFMLQKAYEVGIWLSVKYNWQRVSCVDAASNLLSKEDIHTKIYDKVRDVML